MTCKLTVLHWKALTNSGLTCSAWVTCLEDSNYTGTLTQSWKLRHFPHKIKHRFLNICFMSTFPKTVIILTLIISAGAELARITFLKKSIFHQCYEIIEATPCPTLKISILYFLHPRYWQPIHPSKNAPFLQLYPLTKIFGFFNEQ